MILTQKILDKIDRILTDTDRVEDRCWIESHLAKDPDFQSKMEKLLQLKIAARLSKLRDQFKQLQNLENKIKKKPISKVTFSKMNH